MAIPNVNPPRRDRLLVTVKPPGLYHARLWQGPELCGGLYFFFERRQRRRIPFRHRYSNRSGAARLLSVDTIDYY